MVNQESNRVTPEQWDSQRACAYLLHVAGSVVEGDFGGINNTERFGDASRRVEIASMLASEAAYGGLSEVLFRRSLRRHLDTSAVDCDLAVALVRDASMVWRMVPVSFPLDLDPDERVGLSALASEPVESAVPMTRDEIVALRDEA